MSANATTISRASAMSMSTSVSTNWGRYALLSLGTIVAAVLANTLFYYVASVPVAYDPDFIILENPVGVMIMTFAPAVIAVLLYAALLRFTRRAASVFSIISAIVFVATLIPDLTYVPTVPGSSDAQIAVLMLMHVIAAGVIVRMLTSYQARVR